MNLESLDPERVESALLDNGALSVTLTDAGDDPVLEPAPGETPLWTRTRVTALFDAASDVSKLPDRLRNLLDISDLPAHHFETLEDRVWEREWLSDFGPMVVRLDPGLAVGTDTHATTALCLGWLDDTDLAGKTVFDFGCGSGILGIAALKLGASHVEAVDIDLQAVSATRQNAERNGVAGTLQVGSDTRQATGDFDIIVANILAGTLIDNAGAICDLSRRDGRIALSGILTHQADSVINAFRERVTFDPPAVMGEWVLLTGKRN
jgi:ribosomal protein L11 methyltransferase